ncbi:alpha/beta hydrolase [Nocardioides sp. cx-169]|uniref:alpha/beta fold hydrolase n=1 Tax=Nocardioides sp. cx-169 TaxID=2899080 RepID=UPI001E364F93|nr:alpha/beta hydrolase [Nocardioides sp. cx-169]MCD4536555.1 alpha/beta hydrolase [Nocardioides sp. cx-169]
MQSMGILGSAWPGVIDETLDVGERQVRVLRAPARKGAADGTPQLLIHGLGASAVTWVEVMPGLSATGPVVAVDLPGFGQTTAGPDDALTVDSYVAFVLEVADALGWTRFDLHGNSMGGLIGVLLAAQQPERVARLVLVSPALPPSHPLRLLLPARATIGGMAPLVASTTTAAALGLVGAGASFDERRNRHLLRLIFTDPDGVRPELIDLMAQEFADTDDQVVAGRRRALRTALRSIAALWASPRRVLRAIAAVEAPTLMIGGTADALVPAKVLRQVLRSRPDWVGHVLDDRRHALMMESPEEYLDLVERWGEELQEAV